MSKCDKCGEKIGFFQTKYDYVDDNNGNTLEYCEECNNKSEKEEEKKKQLKRNKYKKNYKSLEKDKLVDNFVFKNLHFCLTLSPKILKNIRDLFDTERTNMTKSHFNVLSDDEDNINETIENFNSEELYEFRNALDKDNLIHLYKTINYLLSEDEINSSLKNDANLFSNDFCLLFFDNNSQEYLGEDIIKFFDLLIRKYEYLETTPVVTILNNKVKSLFVVDFINKCNEKNAKNKIFDYLIDSFSVLINKDESPRYWVEQIVEIAQVVMKENKVIKHESVDEFLEELRSYHKKNELDSFEKRMLKDSEELISIEDIDLMNGFEFEGFVSKLFSKMGYKTLNTKLSGDQGADVILERNGNKTVVQAKCYTGKVNNKAVQEIVASMKHYKAESGMVVTNSTFTKSAIELADSNDIRLIDREKLSELINKYMC